MITVVMRAMKEWTRDTTRDSFFRQGGHTAASVLASGISQVKLFYHVCFLPISVLTSAPTEPETSPFPAWVSVSPCVNKRRERNQDRQILHLVHPCQLLATRAVLRRILQLYPRSVGQTGTVLVMSNSPWPWAGGDRHT